MKKSMRIVLGFVLCLASVLLFPQGAQATDGTWTNLTSGVKNWSAAPGWLSGIIADGQSATANFNVANLTGARQINLDSARTIGTLNIGDTDSSPGTAKYSITNDAVSLTFDNNGSGAALNQISTSLGDTISCPVALNDNLTINNASVSNLTLSGAISGAYKLTKTGSGSVTLNRTNTFNGLTIKEGTVINTLPRFDSDGASALGSGTITLGDTTGSANATLLFNGGSPCTNSNPLIIQANATAGTLSITPATGKSVLFTNTVTMDNALTIDTLVNGSGKVNLSGAITGAGALTKIGTNSTSALTLAGNNSGFSGAINLSGGTLVVSNNNALGTGRLTIGAGTVINAQGSDVVNAGNNPQTWQGGFTFTGSANLDLGTGAVTMETNVDINTGGRILTIGGTIDDADQGFMLKNIGGGTLKLSGNNTYSGGTWSQRGHLIITSDSNLGDVPSSPAINLTVGDATNRWKYLYAYEDMTLHANRKVSIPWQEILAVKSGKTLTIAGEVTGDIINFCPISGIGPDNTAVLGTLVLSPGNTYTNITVIDGGKLVISADSCLGTVPSAFTDGAVKLGGSARPTLTYNATLGVTETFALDANRGIMLHNPLNAIEVAADRTFTVPGAIVSFLNTNVPAFCYGLNKTGDGTLVLSGASTYTGNTAVVAGKLLVNGSIQTGASTGTVSVASGATLGGNGTINGPVTVAASGTLAPGASSAGTLTVAADVTLADESTLAVEAGATSDQLDLGTLGNITLTGAELTVADTGAITVGTVITIVDNAASVTGEFNSLTNGAALDTVNNRYKINYGATSVSLEVMEKPSYLTAGSTNTLVGVVGGNYTFNIGIVSGAVCHVVASTNLLDPNGWVNISGPLVSINGNVAFADTNTANFPARMYRVISP